MELETITNRCFGPGETVELDGKSFINCVFGGCEVVYGAGETFWHGATWRDCHLTFVRSTLIHTIDRLNSLNGADGALRRNLPYPSH